MDEKNTTVNVKGAFGDTSDVTEKTETPKETITTVDIKQDKDWIELKGKTDNLQNQVLKIEEKFDRFDDKIKDSNIKTIETLGIFVALFTFVSIEFQIFRSFSSWYAGASLSLIILGALTFFVLQLTTLLNEKRIKYLWYFAIFSFICIVGGVLFLGSSTKIDSDYILKTEISKSFYTRDELLQFVNDNKSNKEWLNCLRDAGYFKLKCFK